MEDLKVSSTLILQSSKTGLYPTRILLGEQAAIEAGSTEAEGESREGAQLHEADTQQVPWAFLLNLH